jgi:hypothetical protein
VTHDKQFLLSSLIIEVFVLPNNRILMSGQCIYKSRSCEVEHPKASVDHSTRPITTRGRSQHRPITTFDAHAHFIFFSQTTTGIVHTSVMAHKHTKASVDHSTRPITTRGTSQHRPITCLDADNLSSCSSAKLQPA